VNENDKPAEKPGDVMETTDAASVERGVVDDHADVQNAQTKTVKMFRSRENRFLGLARAW